MLARFATELDYHGLGNAADVHVIRHDRTGKYSITVDGVLGIGDSIPNAVGQAANAVEARRRVRAEAEAARRRELELARQREEEAARRRAADEARRRADRVANLSVKLNDINYRLASEQARRDALVRDLPYRVGTSLDQAARELVGLNDSIVRLQGEAAAVGREIANCR